MAAPGQEPVQQSRILWEIEQEYLRRHEYTAAADFWDSYDNKLVYSRDSIKGNRTDMEVNSGWTSRESAAAAAFYTRIEAGIASIDGWLGGRPEWPGFVPGTSTIGEEFRNLVGEIESAYHSVAELNDQLVKQDSAAIDDATARRAALVERFNNLATRLKAVQDSVKWDGPTMLAGDAPPGGSPTGGPGTAAPGGPGAQPGAGPNAPAMQAPTPGPGADQPGPNQAGADQPTTTPGTDPPATDVPGADPPAADVPGAELPGDSAPVPASLPSAVSRPPLTGDPELAGAPSATMTPLPGNVSSIPGAPAGLPGPAGGNPGVGPVPPSVPFAPAASAPVPVRRDGAEPFPPARSGSTVDGPRGTAPAAPGATVPAAGQGSVRPLAGGLGYFPPMVPPVGRPGSGGSGDVRPGNAASSGVNRQPGGRYSARAGLRPQLLGRTGDPDADRRQAPPANPTAGGEVLDDELWQVPGAAPAKPPKQLRRDQ